MIALTLEGLIRMRLLDSELIQNLTRFNDVPAVFYQLAPDDTSLGWKDGRQYPRISYIVDYISNAERKTSGVLTVNIFCVETGEQPEDIEPIVRSLLCGVFLTPETGIPYSLAWTRSDAFDAQREKDDGLVTGVTITFDLFAFPSQITTDPDPILAANQYIASAFPEAKIIQARSMPEIFIPTENMPALYARLESLQLYRETNTVAWLDGVIACHIFANGDETTWLMKLVDQLTLDAEILMLDESPMLLQNLRADNTLNALSQGQLRIYVRYGVLRRLRYSHPLWHLTEKIEPITNGG